MESWTVCPLHRAPWRATEWKVKERMQKNGGRIGEKYKEIIKRMRAKFLI